jgi:hypothetical protein
MNHAPHFMTMKMPFGECVQVMTWSDIVCRMTMSLQLCVVDLVTYET